MRKFIVPLAAVAVVVTGVAASSVTWAQQVVKIGVQPATHPVYIAREMGLLADIEKKYNVKFEWPLFSYGAPEIRRSRRVRSSWPPRAWVPRSSRPPVCRPS